MSLRESGSYRSYVAMPSTIERMPRRANGTAAKTGVGLNGLFIRFLSCGLLVHPLFRWCRSCAVRVDGDAALGELFDHVAN